MSSAPNRLTKRIRKSATIDVMAVRFVQTLCTTILILLLLARETVSYLLFHFPAETFLWKLSLGMGYGFLPLQGALDAYLVGGFAGKVLILGALLGLAWYAFVRNQRLAAAVMCHFAFLCLCLVLLMTAPSASLVSAYWAADGPAPGIATVSAAVTHAGGYLPLLCLLFLGCVLSHIEYIRAAMAPARMPAQAPGRSTSKRAKHCQAG